MNIIIKNNFITQEEVEIIKSFEMPHIDEVKNNHIKFVRDATCGWSIMKDFNQTELSKEITKFQGDGTLIENDVPVYFQQLGEKIAKIVGISSEHMFFQYIVIGPGGKISKHYDVGKPGYITYKCNVCVDGPLEDIIYIGDKQISIKPLGLYCFEANLYKHWMDIANTPRLLLSYGYLVPYKILGWSEESPRVRLSNRIWKAYIKK